jgi:hypothetical protein
MFYTQRFLWSVESVLFIVTAKHGRHRSSFAFHLTSKLKEKLIFQFENSSQIHFLSLFTLHYVLLLLAERK